MFGCFLWLECGVTRQPPCQLLVIHAMLPELDCKLCSPVSICVICFNDTLDLQVGCCVTREQPCQLLGDGAQRNAVHPCGRAAAAVIL
jgi:hypothetical protein